MRCRLQNLFIYVRLENNISLTFRFFCGGTEVSMETHVTQTMRTIHLRKFSIKFVSRGTEKASSAEHIVWRVSFVCRVENAVDRWQTMVVDAVTMPKLLFLHTFHGHKYSSRSNCLQRAGWQASSYRHRHVACVSDAHYVVVVIVVCWFEWLWNIHKIYANEYEFVSIRSHELYMRLCDAMCVCVWRWLWMQKRIAIHRVRILQPDSDFKCVHIERYAKIPEKARRCLLQWRQQQQLK